jgi:antimicrobial peptide system SdpA family protein
MSETTSRTPLPTYHNPRRLGLVALATLASFALPIGYALHAAMPTNVVHLPGEGHFDARVFVPQGWKFFTRDARDERTAAFRRDRAGRWAPADVPPNASAANLFGLDRGGRVQGVETGLLTHQGRVSWVPCPERQATLCLERAAPSASLLNVVARPTLCGVIGLVRQEPVPWAWLRTAPHTQMPMTVARIEVSC